ncbi:MAG TPA: hypothetical protein VF493_16590, partial [Terriglobales bacterium]
MPTSVGFRSAVIALLSFAALPGMGQTGNTGGTGGTGSGGRTPSTSTGSTSIPRSNPNPPQERQVYFVEGRVTLAD